MSAVDDYFDGLDASSRAAFEHIRNLATEVAPEVDEGTSYGMAALTYKQKPLLGFRAAKQHLSIFPFSPQAIDGVRDQLAGYELAKGTVRFTVGKPPPDDAVRELVRRRVAEIEKDR
jgi:uncharacterized protein YdhG (YjbR/CyaY superfamily)